MFGFVVGTLCLVGLVKVARGSRFGRHGWGRYRLLRGVFEKLDTSPGQEKAIREAMSELRDRAKQVKSDLKNTRGQWVEAIRAPVFDETTVGSLVAATEDSIAEMRKAALAAFAKVHGVLDAEQRNKLADMLDRGVGFGHGHAHAHPYRAVL